MLEEKRLQEHFSQPLSDAEKGSAKYTTAAAVADFFAPKNKTVKAPVAPVAKQVDTTMTKKSTKTVIDTVDIDFCAAVTAKVEKKIFVKSAM